MTTTPAQSHRPPAPEPSPASTSGDTREPRVRLSGPTAPPPTAADAPAPTAADSKDLKNLPVRVLLTELARIDNQLRSTPFLLSEEGGTRVNPEAALLLSRQRAVVEQLRRRRVAWSDSPGARERSAAWPPPPWS